MNQWPLQPSCQAGQKQGRNTEPIGKVNTLAEAAQAGRRQAAVSKSA